MNARALAAASLAVALGACSVPEHENPYDPQTPPPLQARATLRGTVTLERLGDEPPALEGVNVSVSGIGAAVTNAAGEWLLAQVPQGSYTVQTIKEGYETAVVSGVVVELDDGGQDVWVAPVTMRVARGTLAGVVQLSAGAVDGFQPGTDCSGVVVTLSGTGVPLPAAVTDAAGAYRFVDVPASLAGGAYTVSARKPFYAGDEATASVTADATATAPLLTLTVNPSSATGEALLWDNVANGGANDTSAGIDVSLTGTAFDGTAFSRATTTLASGAFALDPLPAGTYDVVATSATRACGAFARVTVTPGDTISLGAVGCVDTVAPSAVVLGDPVAPSGERAATRGRRRSPCPSPCRRRTPRRRRATSPATSSSSARSPTGTGRRRSPARPRRSSSRGSRRTRATRCGPVASTGWGTPGPRGACRSSTTGSRRPRRQSRRRARPWTRPPRR